MRTLALVLLALLALCALPARSEAGCTADRECKAGRRCVQGACVKPCDKDTDCPGELQCSAGACVPPSEAAAPLPTTAPAPEAPSSAVVPPHPPVAPERAAAPAEESQEGVRLTVSRADDGSKRYHAVITSAAGQQTCSKLPCTIRVAAGEVSIRAQGEDAFEGHFTVTGDAQATMKATRSRTMPLAMALFVGTLGLGGLTADLALSEGFGHSIISKRHPAGDLPTIASTAASTIFIGLGVAGSVIVATWKGSVDLEQVHRARPQLSLGVAPVPGGAVASATLPF